MTLDLWFSCQFNIMSVNVGPQKQLMQFDMICMLDCHYSCMKIYTVHINCKFIFKMEYL